MLGAASGNRVFKISGVAGFPISNHFLAILCRYPVIPTRPKIIFQRVLLGSSSLSSLSFIGSSPSADELFVPPLGLEYRCT